MTFINIRKKSLISIRARVSGFAIFRAPISTFFNSKVSFLSTTKKKLASRKIEEKELKQTVILRDDGCTMYVTISDVDTKIVPLLFKIRRPNLPFDKMERKFAGSISSLLTSYFTKFRRARDFERILPVLSYNFISSVIAHQLRVANYSIEEILNLISEFEQIILREYEGEPVRTGVLLSRNFYYLNQHKERIGIHLTPINNLYFDKSLFKTKRGLLLVDGESSFFVINRKRKIYAILSRKQSDGEKTEFENDQEYIPDPVWLCNILRGRDYAIYSTPHREIELICRGHLKLKFKHGRWSTIPLVSFFEVFRRRFNNPEYARKLLKLIEHLSSSRKGALFVVVEDDNLLPDLIERKKDKVDSTLRGALNILSSPPGIIENISTIDGAVVLNRNGDVLASGAHIKPKSISNLPIEGTRTAAALSSSYYALSIKVSHDGDVAVYEGGKTIFQIL